MHPLDFRRKSFSKLRRRLSQTFRFDKQSNVAETEHLHHCTTILICSASRIFPQIQLQRLAQRVQRCVAGGRGWRGGPGQWWVPERTLKQPIVCFWGKKLIEGMDSGQPGRNWLSQCQKIPSFLHQHICLASCLFSTWDRVTKHYNHNREKKDFCAKKRTKRGPSQQFGP